MLRQPAAIPAADARASPAVLLLAVATIGMVWRALKLSIQAEPHQSGNQWRGSCLVAPENPPFVTELRLLLEDAFVVLRRLAAVPQQTPDLHWHNQC